MPIIFIFRKVIMWTAKRYWLSGVQRTHTAVLSHFPLRSVSNDIFRVTQQSEINFHGPFHVRLGALKKETKKNVINFLPPNIQSQSFSLLEETG